MVEQNSDFMRPLKYKVGIAIKFELIGGTPGAWVYWYNGLPAIPMRGLELGRGGDDKISWQPLNNIQAFKNNYPQ